MDDERRDTDTAAPDVGGANPSPRVRIIGAEPVGTGERAPAAGADRSDAPPEGGAATTGASSWSSGLGLSGPAEEAGGTGGAGLDDDMADWASTTPEHELPHWTEAPTGEVPAVLARDRGELGEQGDLWAAVPAPTWREEQSDWEADDDAFEPSMLGRDDVTMSDRHESLDSERQPWTFDLSSGAGAGSGPPGSSASDSDWSQNPPPPPSDDDDASLFSSSTPDDAPEDDTMIVPSLGSLGLASRRDDPEPDDRGALAVDVDDDGDDTAADADDASNAAAGEALATRRRLDSGGTPDATAAPLVVADEEPDAIEGDDPLVAGAAGILPASLRNRFRRKGRQDEPDLVTPVARATSAPGAPAASVAATGVAATGAAAAGAAAAGAAIAEPPPRPVPQAPPPLPGAAGADTVGDTMIVRRVPPVPLAPPGRAASPGERPGNGSPAGTGAGERRGRDLPIAVIAGIVLGVAVIVAFDLGTVLAMLVVTAVVFVATIEALTAFRHAGHRPAVLLGWVATVSLMIATYNKGLVALPLLVVLTLALTMLWYMAGVERGADPLRGTADTMFVFCWIGVFGSYAALLLNPTLFPDKHGLAFLMGAIICTVAYDVAALAVGSWIGSRSLAPSISPGKTWEGAIGGGVAAVLAGVVIVHFIHPWTATAAAVLGLVVAVVAPLGDLFESVVKRHLGLKDIGRILPGHGGILDRCDGLLFVLPATYYVVKAFHLG